MYEYGGIQEPSVYSGNLHLWFRDGQTEVQVTTMAGGVKEAVEFIHRACNQWLADGYRKYDIPEVPEFWSVVVAQESPVPEHQKALPLGVPADCDLDVLDLVDRFALKTMPVEDLTEVSRIIADELGRRSRAEYWHTATPDTLDIHGEIGRAPTTASPPGLGDGVNNNKV